MTGPAGGWTLEDDLQVLLAELDLVAVGIENERELDAPLEAGIVYGQGYYLGRPAPLPIIRSVPQLTTRL